MASTHTRLKQVPLGYQTLWHGSGFESLSARHLVRDTKEAGRGHDGRKGGRDGRRTGRTGRKRRTETERDDGDGARKGDRRPAGSGAKGKLGLAERRRTRKLGYRLDCEERREILALGHTGTGLSGPRPSDLTLHERWAVTGEMSQPT
jgi:hypothetical protein